MANNTLPGLSPTLLKVLEIAKLGVPVSPSQINDHIGKGNYAAKHVLYLKILGYDFSVAKSGRNVVSYTLIKEPANAAALVANATNKTSKAKTPKAKTVKLSTVIKKVNKEFTAKKAAESAAPAPVKAKAAKRGKSVADIKAANLAKLKAVGAKFKAEKIEVLTEEPAATSFSIDGDWDSFDGVDIKNLL
jgi:hypothetical protein